MTEKRLKELMKIEHEQWCYWSKGISESLRKLISLIKLETLDNSDTNFVKLQLDRLERWEYFWRMDYDEYGGDKEVERLYAQKVIQIFSELAEENKQLKQQLDDSIEMQNKQINSAENAFEELLKEKEQLKKEINILRGALGINESYYYDRLLKKNEHLEKENLKLKEDNKKLKEKIKELKR